MTNPLTPGSHTLALKSGLEVVKTSFLPKTRKHVARVPFRDTGDCQAVMFLSLRCTYMTHWRSCMLQHERYGLTRLYDHCFATISRTTVAVSAHSMLDVVAAFIDNQSGDSALSGTFANF